MASVEREELTAVARRYLLETCPLVGREALRIIDANAADRAALVAQLEAARELLERHFTDESEAAWERDVRGYLDGLPPTHAALVDQVAELTRERDEARAECQEWNDELDARVDGRCRAADAEVTRLTEALAAAERRELADLSVVRDRAQSAEDRAEAAEARVRELEAEVNGLREQCRRDRESAEARVRELEADHAEMKAERDDAWNRRDEEIADRKALETLLAASEAREAIRG